MAAKASTRRGVDQQEKNNNSSDEVGTPIITTPKRSEGKTRKRSNSEGAAPSTKNTAVTPVASRGRRSKSIGADKKKKKGSALKKSSSKKEKAVKRDEDEAAEEEEVPKEMEVEADNKTPKKRRSVSKKSPSKMEEAVKRDEDEAVEEEEVPKEMKVEVDDNKPKKRRRKKSIADEQSAAVLSPMVSTGTDDAPVEEIEKKAAPVFKPLPSLNVKVHRMRHLNFTPKAIICMATTPHNDNGCNYVAVSRKGGAVELKSPDEKWRTVAQIAGMSDKTVDCMTWICGSCDDSNMKQSGSFSSDFHKSLTHVQSQRTLIGAGKDGTLFVVDFSKGGSTMVTGSGGGGVFSLVSLCNAQQCCKSGSCPGLVAAGCEDGSMRIYKLNKNSKNEDRLDLVSTVPSAGASVLSMAWIRNQGYNSSNGMDDTILYAGVADGTIRRYECRSAVSQARSKGTIVNDKKDNDSYGKHTWLSKIRMTVESYGRTLSTRVWNLQALSDGTVISGDSLGHVQFWDGKTGTLLQSFDQNDKKADILALAITPDECQVFASGIDSRVICIERSTTAASQHQAGPVKWIMTSAQRPHTHDVKALVVSRVHDQGGSLVQGKAPMLVLCSGGVDTKICSFRIKEFKSGRPRTFFPWPTISPISVAPKGRILLMRREDTIELHQLGPKQTNEKMPISMEEDKRFIGTMDIQSSHNLVCSDISPDGKYVVASTGSSTILFEMEYLENDDGSLGFTPKQIILDNDSKAPCLAVKFASADSLVCVHTHGVVRLLKITELASEDQGDDEGMDMEEAKASTVSSFKITDTSALFAVHSLAISEDGKFFATVRSGVGNGTVTVFAIKDGAIHQFWTVSALEAPVSSVGFLPGGKLLAVACTNYAMYVFNVKKRKLSDWSEKSGFPVTPSLPFELNRPLDFPTRVISNPKTPEKFLLSAFGSFCAVNMTQGMPKRCRSIPEEQFRRKKRKRFVAETSVDPNHGNCTLCQRYNSIIHMDYISDDEILVVEQPWLSVVAGFPGALERKVYGT